MKSFTPADLAAELNKVSVVLNDAIRKNEISNIEKDIALERLRKIYDAFRELDFVPDVEQTDVLSAYLGEIEVKKEVDDVKEQKEEITPIEDLIEKPFSFRPPVDRNIIKSLYGDDEFCPANESAPESKPEVQQPQTEEKKGSAELSGKVFNETQTPPAKDIASMLFSQTNSQLRKSIGLNDRLMLLNDLFNNDGGLCDATLDALDEFRTIDDAYIYLYEHFSVDNEKEGVKLLISLLESKYN